MRRCLACGGTGTATTATLAWLLGSRLAVVFELMGALVVGSVIFLAPAALLFADRTRTAVAVVMTLVGGFVTVSGTYIAIAGMIPAANGTTAS